MTGHLFDPRNNGVKAMVVSPLVRLPSEVQAQAHIAELAQLPPPGCVRVRVGQAMASGVRVATLDREEPTALETYLKQMSHHQGGARHG